MDPDRLRPGSARSHYPPKYSSDSEHGHHGKTSHQERDTSSSAAILVGNLIDLDSPPSSAHLATLSTPAPQIDQRTDKPAAKPTIPNIITTQHTGHSTSSQGQRGRGYPPSSGIRSPVPKTGNTPPSRQTLSARSKWRANMEPDSILVLGDLNATKDASITSLFGRTTARPGRIGIFDDVCRTTGAFIKPPVESDTKLYIWGNDEQVKETREMIHDLAIEYRDGQLAKKPKRLSPKTGTSRVHRCRQPKPPRQSPGFERKHSLEWEKISPYQNSEEMKRKQEKMALEALRKEPKGVECKQKLIFVWPTDGPSPQECLGMDLEKLDSIRFDHRVHAYLDPQNPTLIVIANNEGFNSRSVVDFLRAAWKEGMGRTDLHIKKLMLAPLSPEFSKHGVTIERHGSVTKPFLHRIRSEDANSRRLAFTQVMDSIRGSIFDEILQNMQTSLSMINYFNGNLRMRFHFGTFVLDRFRLLQNGVDAFYMAEFAAMIGHEQCRGRVVPGLKIGTDDLLDRLRQADDLLEPFGQVRPLNELEFMEPTHSATIEFTQDNSDFRLELYLKRISRAGEVEIKGHRWFKARRGEDKTLRMPLQLAMVDFARADWQCNIEFFEVAEERELTKSHHELAFSIRFASNGDSHHFVSKAAMNIIISKDTPDASIVKKSAIRFKVKGTSLILELARFDVYRRATYFNSYLSATLFDPNWDSLMEGEIGVGGVKDQSRGAGLEAFFPSTRGGNAEEGAGLGEVLQVVQRIAALMGSPEIGLSGPAKDESMAGLMDLELGTLF